MTTYLFLIVRGKNYHRHGQSSCICVRLFRSQCKRIAPSLREHICTTLDRPSVNKYWGTGSKAKWKGMDVYYVYDDYFSCLMCTTFKSDGERFDWSKIDPRDFWESATDWECIYRSSFKVID